VAIGLGSIRYIAYGEGGKSSRVEVEVRNMTRHNIQLRGCTVLGHLQLVQSVVPID
jgi:hypothetical protein